MFSNGMASCSLKTCELKELKRIFRNETEKQTRYGRDLKKNKKKQKQNPQPKEIRKNSPEIHVVDQQRNV